MTDIRRSLSTVDSLIVDVLTDEVSDVECIAVSHGHWDHMGALPAAIGAIVDRGGRVTVHINPDMFNERGVRLNSHPSAKVVLPAELEQRGANVVNSSMERLLLDGHFYYSGEIPRVTAFERAGQDHLCRSGPDALWRPDPLLMDERMLLVHVRHRNGQVSVFTRAAAGQHIRAKGVIWLDASESQYGFHLVGQRFTLDESGPAKPINNKLVLIGRNLDHKRQRDQLENCLAA